MDHSQMHVFKDLCCCNSWVQFQSHFKGAVLVSPILVSLWKDKKHICIHVNVKIMVQFC